MSKSLNTNFHLFAPKPLDDRLVVNAFVDLDAIPVKYNHMVVHVESTDKDWKYYSNTNSWIDVTLDGPTVWGDIIGTIADQTDLMAEFAKYALVGHTHPATPYTHTHPESDITDLDKYTQEEVDSLIAYKTAFSTGDIKQGLVTITAGDDTTFDLAAGIGVKTVWSPSDPFAPPVTYPVEYDEVLAIAPTYLATHPATYIGLSYDEIGDTVTIVQSSSPFSATARRSIIAKAVIEHGNNTNITSISNEINPSVQVGQTVQDLAAAIGPLNTTGNIYFANGTNLSINKSAGVLSKLGSSYDTPNDPSTKISTLQTALTFRYRLQDSTEYVDTTTIDPAYYDNAGVRTIVPDGKWTIQRLYLMVSGETRVQYGQVLYDTLSDALFALEYDSFVTDSQLETDGVLRGYLPVANTATDLSNPLEADFIRVDKWGWAVKPKNGNIIESTADLRNNGEDGDNPFITLLDLYRDNKLINGDYYNIANTYQFFVWADNYILDNINYTTYIEDTVTLAAADLTPGQDRFDVIVINLDQTISVVSGVTSATPEIPNIDDNTQLTVGVVLVSGATTAPVSVVNTTVFDENLQEVGGEWDTALTGSASSSEVIDPSAGTIHASLNLTSDILTLNNSVSITSGEFDKLIFKIKLISGSDQKFYVKFFTTGSGSQWRVPLEQGYFGFDGSNFSTYQTIIINANWINLSSFDNVQIEKRTAGVCYIDEISFQKGTPTDNGTNVIPGLQEVTDRDPNTTNPMFMDVSIASITGNSNGKILTTREWVLVNSGGSTIENRYANIAAMLANQGNQTDQSKQFVTDASADITVTSGWAEYEYLGTVVGDITDYRKSAEQESLDVVPTALTKNTIFVSSTGNDGTAVAEDEAFPFLTFDAAVDYMEGEAHLGKDWFIEFLSASTFTYTQDLVTLNGFNLISKVDAVIRFEGSMTVNEQFSLFTTDGTIVFSYEDGITTINSGILQIEPSANTNIFISRLDLENNRIGTPNLSRGITRNIGIIERFYIGILNIRDGASKFTEATPNLTPMYYDTINNYTDSNSGATPFALVHAVPQVVNEYNNLSTSIHSLGIESNSITLDMDIGVINSASALIRYRANGLNLRRNVSYENTVLDVYFGDIYILNGNGFQITMNHSITSDVFRVDQGNKKAVDGYDPDNFVLIKNLRVKVLTGSLTTRFILVDLRSGRTGNLFIFDGCEMWSEDAMVFMFINNHLNTNTATQQLIFRNSNRIINNDYLISSASGVNPPQDLVLQENASVYHDYGLVSSNANIQKNIPTTNTYGPTENKIKRSLTASEINNIGTTQIELIEAPGTGKAIKIISAFARLTWGSTAFDDNTLDLVTATGAVKQFSVASFINTSADTLKTFQPESNDDNIVEDDAIELDGTDSVAVGDSTVDIYITYEIITL